MKRHAAIGLLVALPLLLFVHRVVIDAPRTHGFESFDATEYLHPTAAYVHDSLREGRLPLWNPYQLAGQPFLALHVPGALYPPNLVLQTLLSPGNALAALTILHLAIAGGFTWLFAARLGLGTAAALAAGAGYMLSGSLVFGIYNHTYLTAMTWLPAILWAIHGLCSDPRGRWSVGLACLLALAFLGGHSQGFVYALHLALPYGLFALFVVAPRGRRTRALLLAAAGGLLATGLAAPQALPTLELHQQAVRSLEGHSFRDATLASFTKTRVVQGVLGQPAPEAPRRPVGPLRWAASWPALGLPLFVCGLWARRQRAHWIFFALASVAAGLFVLGRHTPMYGLYYALPFGDLFRAPIRLAFVYNLCVAVAVAIGVQGVHDRLQPSRPRVATALPAVLAVTLAIGLYLRSELVATHPVLERRDSEGPSALVEPLRKAPERGRILLSGFTSLDAVDLGTKSGMVHRFFAVPDYEPAIPEAYRRYFEQPKSPPWHGELGAPRTGPPLAELTRQLDMMGVRYELAPRESDAHAIGDPGRGVGAVTLLERPGALPRAYAVRRVIEEPDPERAMAGILAPDFEPRRVAIVDAIDPHGPGASLGAARPGAGSERDRVSIASYAPEEVALLAECSQACLVVLTDLFYPGWRAYVDGRERTVHRVNTLYRGVALAPGRHRIVYRFESTPLRVGAMLATISALVGASMLGADLGRSRRAARRHPALPMDGERET